MKEIKIIKRYQNRKLYDTHESSYVTLDEIAKMIKGGEDLRVIDNKTKNDITAATLTQLLYESERKSKTQPSVDLLKEIIRHGDGSFSGYIQTKIGGDVSGFGSLSTPGLKESDAGLTSRAPIMNQ
jgi:polyhydroxyalkanoate synthesis repressor PhaR